MFLVQEGWPTETGDKPEVTQQVCESPSFQDGRNAYNEGFHSAKGLTNTSRFEGCLEEKAFQVRKEARLPLAQDIVSARDLARFIGRLSAAILAV